MTSSPGFHLARIDPADVDGVVCVSIRSARSFPAHSHDQLGIGLMVEGSHRSKSAKGLVSPQCGDVIAVNPGEIHDGEFNGHVRSWRMIFLDSAFTHNEFGPAFENGTALFDPHIQSPQLARALRAMFRSIDSGDQDVEERIVCALQLFAGRHFIAGRAEQQPEAVLDQVIDAIRSDPARQLRLCEMADMVGATRLNFLRSFSRRFQCTPHAFLMQQRVKLAMTLLKGRESLAEVAVEAGFSDQSHLTRNFVRQTGITPGRFRAAVH